MLSSELRYERRATRYEMFLCTSPVRLFPLFLNVLDLARVCGICAATTGYRPSFGLVVDILIYKLLSLTPCSESNNVRVSRFHIPALSLQAHPFYSAYCCCHLLALSTYIRRKN